MNAYYKGQPIFGPRGPAGPDGNPVGTIISFMGTTAPEDYLFCDGTVHNISDYPDLAAFFGEQFGSMNYFGGDGTTTFAVPDMRNLFLRGWHGEAEERLSGEVGERQGATDIPNIFWTAGTSSQSLNAYYDMSTFGHASNIDANGPKSDSRDMWVATSRGSSTEGPVSYTTRPVNMAVLYCIKAVESVPAENVYSTEETRIGTWIDGKPIYRKSYTFIAPYASGDHATDINPDVFSVPNIDTLINIDAAMRDPSDEYKHLCEYVSSMECIYGFYIYDDGHVYYHYHNMRGDCRVWLSVTYTKTTD